MIRIQINFTDLRRINAAQKLTQTRVQNAIAKFGNRDKDCRQPNQPFINRLKVRRGNIKCQRNHLI